MSTIKTVEQYNWAVARVEELLPMVDEKTPRNDPRSIELELLSELVADYSEEHYDIGEPSLSDVVKLRMHEMGLSQKALAELIEVSPSRISDFFNGRAEPTLKTARKLCTCLNIDASVVLGV